MHEKAMCTRQLVESTYAKKVLNTEWQCRFGPYVRESSACYRICKPTVDNPLSDFLEDQTPEVQADYPPYTTAEFWMYEPHSAFEIRSFLAVGGMKRAREDGEGEDAHPKKRVRWNI
jgi:hypothetical protein